MSALRAPGRAWFGDSLYYGWIYERVLEDTAEIGALVTASDLLLTPDAGVVVETPES